MAAIATLAWPRLASAGALLGLALLGDHEAPRNRPVSSRVEALAPEPPSALGIVIVPGPFVDAAPWPRGMVIVPPETGDHMAFGVVPAPGPAWPHPLVQLLSGLFEALSGRGA